MPENCRAGIGYWLGISTPDSPLDGTWLRGYPHNHVTSVEWPAATTTVITFLIAPDAGGALGVGGPNESDPYIFITPKPGLSIIHDATIWHGVKPVTAGTRMTLITSGPPIE